MIQKATWKRRGSNLEPRSRTQRSARGLKWGREQWVEQVWRGIRENCWLLWARPARRGVPSIGSLIFMAENYSGRFHQFYLDGMPPISHTAFLPCAVSRATGPLIHFVLNLDPGTRNTNSPSDVSRDRGRSSRALGGRRQGMYTSLPRNRSTRRVTCPPSLSPSVSNIVEIFAPSNWQLASHQRNLTLIQLRGSPTQPQLSPSHAPPLGSRLQGCTTAIHSASGRIAT